MKAITIMILAAAAVLSGCATRVISDADMAWTTPLELCHAYSNPWYKKAPIRQALEDRNALTPDEWHAINNRRAYVGMSEAAFICAWGPPYLLGRVNYYTDAYGRTTQYIYESRGEFAVAATFVYARGGKITAIDRAVF